MTSHTVISRATIIGLETKVKGLSYTVEAMSKFLHAVRAEVVRGDLDKLHELFEVNEADYVTPEELAD